MKILVARKSDVVNLVAYEVLDEVAVHKICG